MASEDWRRLADYVVARRVELGRRAFAEATGVTERTTTATIPPGASPKKGASL